MVARGTSQNVGSFLGDGTLRVYAKGEESGALTPAERDTARAAMARAMEDGAFGLASALIYPPNTYASTEELVDAAKAMSPYGGVYITHMRSEGDKFLEAIDEALRIGREGNVPVEIYHLKASGPRNWAKMPLAIAKIDSARAAGTGHPGRHVPLPGRRQLLLGVHPAQVRLRRAPAREPAGLVAPQDDDRRDARRRRGLREPLPDRHAGQCDGRRLQEPRPQEVRGEAARRDLQGVRQGLGGGDHRPQRAGEARARERSSSS